MSYHAEQYHYQDVDDGGASYWQHQQEQEREQYENMGQFQSAAEIRSKADHRRATQGNDGYQPTMEISRAHGAVWALWDWLAIHRR